MLRFILLINLILGFSQFIQAQDAEDIAKSEEYYRLGMEVFDYAHRKQATDLFLQSVAYNPFNAKAHLMAGRAIMLTINKEFALPHLLQAYELDNNVDPDILFYIGEAYHHDMDFENALIFYDRYYQQLVRSMDFAKTDKIHLVNRKMFECRNAKIYVANPVNVEITHLDENINSEWPDYAPAVNASGDFMIFTTRRPDQNTNPSIADDYEYYEEIFYSNKVNGIWQPAKNFGPPINTRFHNASINISPDGKEMFLYNDGNGGDIFFSFRDEQGKWGIPKSLEGINTPYLENSASITKDGKTLYFTSNRPGGYGGTDIYSATLEKNNKWGNIVNLGPLVNSNMDEEAVFISANGVHLYFSSNGHAGMGDLDIYRATLDTITMQWQQPVNLGYPINSVESDIFFALTGNEEFAYMSSVREGSIGEQDIFLVDMRNWQPLILEDMKYDIAPAPISNRVSVAMQYVIVDADDLSIINAEATLKSSGSGKVEIKKTDKGIYEHSFSMNNIESDYTLTVKAAGYENYNQRIHLLGRRQSAYVLLDTIRLQKREVMMKAQSVEISTCVIDVNFAHDSDEPISVAGIQSLLKQMNSSPHMQVELRGFTDNNGHPEYNKNLSYRRALSVKNYLVKSGISEDRIEVVGYGHEQPIADNTTYEGRRLNRRVDYIIINK
jgi:outer membrane protein OmpA-like peptidoglycan-associated protein/tetratricopeptide (TPR) repeat protein